MAAAQRRLAVSGSTERSQRPAGTRSAGELSRNTTSLLLSGHAAASIGLSSGAYLINPKYRYLKVAYILYLVCFACAVFALAVTGIAR